MKRHHIFLAIIFVLTLTFNTVYTLKADEFTGDQAYKILRDVEHIQEEGTPMYSDDLSFGGRNHIYVPFFHYLLAFFSFVLPITFVVKIIPTILISSIVLIVYKIAHKISNNRNVALFSAFMSGFIPVVTSQTLNTVSSYSLMLPLFFLSVYFFIKIEDGKKYVVYFIITYLISILTHPSTMLFLISAFVYMALIFMENIAPSRKEKEVVLFSALFLVWAYFLMYKDILLQYGPEIIWQNIPALMRAEYFSDFNILLGIVNIGLLPFLVGTYIVYQFFFIHKKKTNYFYISIVLTIIVALWLNVIELGVGLSFLSITLVLLFSYFYKNILLYIKKTKFEKHEIKMLFGFVAIFILTSVIPCFMQASQNVSISFDDEEIAAMEWIKLNTPKDSTIIASVHEGSFISYKTGRKTIVDTDFLAVSDANQRLEDVRKIYLTRFQTEAIPLLDKYDADYILFSDRIRQYFGIDSIKYIEDERCFALQYNERVRIYRVKCHLEVVRSE